MGYTIGYSIDEPFSLKRKKIKKLFPECKIIVEDDHVCVYSISSEENLLFEITKGWNYFEDDIDLCGINFLFLNIYVLLCLEYDVKIHDKILLEDISELIDILMCCSKILKECGHQIDPNLITKTLCIYFGEN